MFISTKFKLSFSLPSILFHRTSRQLLHNYANQVETFRKIILCQKVTVQCLSILKNLTLMVCDTLAQCLSPTFLNPWFFMEWKKPCFSFTGNLLPLNIFHVLGWRPTAQKRNTLSVQSPLLKSEFFLYRLVSILAKLLL